MLQQEQGQYQQALELAQRGLDNKPPYINLNYINLLDTRGMAYYRLGNLEKAIQDFDQCIKMYPDGIKSSISTYLHLGRALAELGRKEKAIEILQHGLKLNNKINAMSQQERTEAEQLIEQLSKGA